MTKLRVACFPSPDPRDRTAYVGLLERALAQAGAEIESDASLRPGWALRTGVDVVHLHWLEYLIGQEFPGRAALLRSLARSVRLVLVLTLLRARGVVVVLTVHNLQPHENQRPRLNASVTHVVLALVNRAITHSQHARTLTAQRFGHARKTNVVLMGNYVEPLPAPRRSRNEVREALGVPQDAFVLLMFGQVRPYKNVPRAIEAFADLPDPDARLVVTGRAEDERLRSRIERAAGGDPRIVLRLDYVPDEEVRELHEAADVAVLAYDELFSSAALLLALSLGLTTIVPAGGQAAEVAEAPAIEPYGPGGLTGAMARARQGDPQARRRAARDCAARFPWETVARQTLDLYERSRPRRRRIAG